MVEVTLQLPDGTAKGRTFVITLHHPIADVDGEVYWWTEGNMSCDCNRALMINQQHDLDLPVECGDTMVLKRLVIDGEEFARA